MDDAVDPLALPAQRVLQPVYVSRCKTYVPHYRKPNLWVALGGEIRPTYYLKAIGARCTYELLWERAWTAKIMESNT
jgi:hypothetical protein